MLKGRFSALMFGLCAVAAIGAGATAPALAHHAVQGQFDVKQTTSFKGKLTKIEMVNPHPQLYFDVKDAKGAPVSWRLEAPAIAALRRMGLLRILKVGDTYTIDLSVQRDGKPVGLLLGITTPDGKKFASIVKDTGKPD